MPRRYAAAGFSSPDKELFPDIGFTKAELWSYYESVAEFILPHIVDRPLTLLRCPAGEGGKCFVQKHLRGADLPGIRAINIGADENDSDYMVVEDIAGLQSLVQQNVLEIHVWGSRSSDLDHPDRLVFDLDPDEALPFAGVVTGAIKVRDLLRGIGLTSFARTTGGKGLHVVVPVQPELDWAAGKDFCHAVVRILEESEPKLYTSRVAKAARKGKIFIDYLRNAREATAIAPYSTRARHAAPVAMPIDWERLEPNFNPAEFTVATALEEIRQRAADPWATLSATVQRIDISRLQ